jgi:DNA-binding NarL/FixJ family response regulator
VHYRRDSMEKSAKPPTDSRNLSGTTAPTFKSTYRECPPASANTLRVLIADDYEAVRLGLCAILRSVNIEVCAQAANGEEAVEKSIQLSPDLIILDISMPGIGGVEAARQIRVVLPDVPILFFTMHNTPQLLAIAKSVGAQGFVTKDRMAGTLLEAVNALRNKQTFYGF